MFGQSALERRIGDMVEVQIRREYEHSRGPKRDVEKVTEILILISRHTRYYLPLSTNEIVNNLLDIGKNDMEDYLAFLTKFPRNKPFLIVEKRPQTKQVLTKNGIEIKKTSGAPSNVYKFNFAWLEDEHGASFTLDTILAQHGEEISPDIAPIDLVVPGVGMYGLGSDKNSSERSQEQKDN